MKGNGNGNSAGLGAADEAVSFAAVQAKIAELKVLLEKGSEIEFELALRQAAKETGLAKGKIRKWVDDGAAGDEIGSVGEALPISPEGARALVKSLKPELVIARGDLPATAYAIRDEFQKSGEFYDRGTPVFVAAPATPDRLPQIAALTVENVILEAHRRFRPVVQRRKGKRTWKEPEMVPDRVARLYRAMKGEWRLPQLQGLSTAPLLTEDGGIRTADGYDAASGLYCAKIPMVTVPEQPSEAEAREALFSLRRAFRTFAFADAVRRPEATRGAQGEALEIPVVDLDKNPGRDESTLLTALLGAVCRPSLWLAPGVMVNAAPHSGSGAGKGLLQCGISVIAFGVLPWRFTRGGGKHNPEELEKRFAAALLEGHPSLLIENINNAMLRSETLESALTDRPCRTRLFGKLEMVELYSTAMVGFTGNGLTPARDLVRKIIVTTLDPKVEVPSLRKFPLPDEAWLAALKARRGALLSAALTIWRFGRRLEAAGRLAAGEALGSYGQFCRWCRDPLLALGCQDPGARIHELRATDPGLEQLAELFGVWWRAHNVEWVAPSARNQPKDTPVLDTAVREIADPDGKGAQYLRTFLNGLDGLRTAGFVFERHKDPGRPTVPATYRIVPTG